MLRSSKLGRCSEAQDIIHNCDRVCGERVSNRCVSPQPSKDFVYGLPFLQELSLVIFLSCCAITSYSQLAAPYCADEPHPLPTSSPLLAGFPCGSTPRVQATYLLSRPLQVLNDISRISRPDSWFRFGVLVWMLRPVCLLLLPYPTYTRVAAPLVTYVFRAGPFLNHLLMGPSHTPSSIAATALLSRHTPAEAAFFLTTQAWSPAWAELLYGIATFAAVATLCSWYGARHPALGIDMRVQLAQRVALTAFNLGVQAVLRRRRGRIGCETRVWEPPSAKHGPAEGKPVHGAGCAAACTGNTAVVPPHEHVSVPPASPALAATVPAYRAAALSASVAPARTAAAAPQARPTPAPGSGSGSGSGSGVPAAPRRAQPPSAAPYAPALPDPPDTTNARDTNPLAPPLTPNAAAAAAAIVAPASTHAIARRSGRLPRYLPFLTHDSDQLKIPSPAHLGMLGPGSAERLAQLMAARGRHLTAVYVRQGCIEVVLESVGVAGDSGVPGCGEEAEQGGAGAGVEAGAGREVDAGSFAAVLAAVEGAGTGTAAAAAAEGHSVLCGAVAPVVVQQRPLLPLPRTADLVGALQLWGGPAGHVGACLSGLPSTRVDVQGQGQAEPWMGEGQEEEEQEGQAEAASRGGMAVARAGQGEGAVLAEGSVGGDVMVPGVRRWRMGGGAGPGLGSWVPLPAGTVAGMAGGTERGGGDEERQQGEQQQQQGPWQEEGVELGVPDPPLWSIKALCPRVLAVGAQGAAAGPVCVTAALACRRRLEVAGAAAAAAAVGAGPEAEVGHGGREGAEPDQGGESGQCGSQGEWWGCGQLEVVVRCQGRHVPCAVRVRLAGQEQEQEQHKPTASAAPASRYGGNGKVSVDESGCRELECCIQLMELPLRPGLLTVDVMWRDEPCCSGHVLLVGCAAAAAELRAVLEGLEAGGWAGGEQLGLTGVEEQQLEQGQRHGLEEQQVWSQEVLEAEAGVKGEEAEEVESEALIRDLGAWFDGAAREQHQQQQHQQQQQLRMLLRELGRHLHRYADASGLVCTAALLQEGLSTS